MKIYLALITIYFRVLNTFNSSFAAEKAFKLFQKTRSLKLKKRERSFYEIANQFTAPSPIGDIPCYELGDSTGKLIILVHGWDSNAGSMYGIGKRLAERAYHVVSMDLPAHGKHQGSHTNLFECKEALKAVINHIKPTGPFSIISHSFGTIVTSFALSETNHQIEQLIFLSSFNELSVIFEQYRDMIQLPAKPYELMIKKVRQFFGEGIENISVIKKLKQVDYKHLMLIHDINDKVLPYLNSQNISTHLARTNLYSPENIGHYRMLWNDDIFFRILKQFNPIKEKSKISVAVV